MSSPFFEKIESAVSSCFEKLKPSPLPKYDDASLAELLNKDARFAGLPSPGSIPAILSSVMIGTQQGGGVHFLLHLGTIHKTLRHYLEKTPNLARGNFALTGWSLEHFVRSPEWAVQNGPELAASVFTRNLGIFLRSCSTIMRLLKKENIALRPPIEESLETLNTYLVQLRQTQASKPIQLAHDTIRAVAAKVEAGQLVRGSTQPLPE